MHLRQFAAVRIFLLAVMATLVCVAACRADQAGADFLKSKGLTKVGQKYVLEGDAALPEWLRQLSVAEKTVQDAVRRRSNLERDIQRAQDAEEGIAEQWVAEKAKLDKISKNSDVTYNKQVDKVNGIRAKGIAAHEQIEKRMAVLRGIGDPSDEYVTLAMKYIAAIDATMEKYAALANDATVTSAIIKANDSLGPKATLGPSERLAAELPAIAKLRERVSTDTINFQFHGNVPTVPVLFNGNVVSYSVVDSGASYVSISDTLAKQLNLTPGPGNKTIKIVTADGTVSDVPVMVIKSVRLGKFTAENVECVIVASNGKEVDTLLGGTFLRRFVYKMDLAAGQLKLSQVVGKTDADAAAPPPRPAPATTAATGDPVFPGKIRILKAEYGKPGKSSDITAVIAAAFEEDPYTPLMSANILLPGGADPAPGESKALHVIYTVDGKDAQETTIKENETSTLIPCPPQGFANAKAGALLKIVAARYGIAKRWLDVTEIVRGKAANAARPFDLSAHDIGANPAPGKQKSLVVWFTYRGRSYVRVVASEQDDLKAVQLVQ